MRNHKRYWTPLAALASVLPLAACATLNWGTVAERLGDDEARVYLGSDDGMVSGDRVALYRQDCLAEMGDSVMFMQDTHCDRIRVGTGTVQDVLGHHESLVKLDPGVRVAYGYVVEKESRQAH